MQVLSTNNVSVMPSFSAKFSPKTLQKISNSVEKSAKGNQELAELLGKINKMGTKDTIIDFGEISKHHSESDWISGDEYSGYLDYMLVSYKVTMPVMFSHPKLPKVTECYEAKFENTGSYIQGCGYYGKEEYPKCTFFDFAKSLADKAANFIEGQEVELLKRFVRPGANGLYSENLAKQIPMLKENFKASQIQKVAEHAYEADSQNVSIIENKLKQQKIALGDARKQIIDGLSDVTIERENILKTFA